MAWPLAADSALCCTRKKRERFQKTLESEPASVTLIAESPFFAFASFFIVANDTFRGKSVFEQCHRRRFHKAFIRKTQYSAKEEKGLAR
jgi:hypothetical protein